MARKKREEAPAGGNAPWLNTFADLMNLLLCFFVLLFAFSDINKEKFEKITISLANSIGVLEAKGSSTVTGELISAGMSQLTETEKYYTTLGESSSNSGLDTRGESDTSKPVDTQSGNQGSKDTNHQSEGSNSTAEVKKSHELEEAIKKLHEEMANANARMYDKISDLTDQYSLRDKIQISIDKNNRYIQLTINGSILFDSGEASIKKEALPIMKNIGNILNKFEGYSVEITGHTDNVPITSKKFKDNNWLSSARALNAAEYLIKDCKIDPSILKYSGRGEFEPVSSNSTPEGRAKNRRIEIKIYNEYSS